MRRRRKPHRIRKKKSILKSRFFRNTIFVLFVVFAGFYFLFLSEFFQVAEIIITGQGEFSNPDIESVVFSGTKNIFLTNTNELKKILLQKFPQIAEVEVKKSFPNILNLALAERKEVGIFCAENQCFLLDGQGVIFEEFNGETTLPKLQNQTLSKELVLGEKVFGKEVLDIILEVEATLKGNLGIFSEEISQISSERLNVKTSEGWKIYFNIKKGLDWQMASLATILEKRLPSEKRSKLEYIDLRFDRIFVYPTLD